MIAAMDQAPRPTPYPLEETLAGALSMEVVSRAPGMIQLRMPLGPNSRQPYGALHGGAVLALMETAASHGTELGVDTTTRVVFGQGFSCSLLRTVWDGHVVATATALHQGSTTWVWDVRVVDSRERLIAIGTGTIAVRPRRGTASESLEP